jgi:hypothetical protein
MKKKKWRTVNVDQKHLVNAILRRYPPQKSEVTTGLAP